MADSGPRSAVPYLPTSSTGTARLLGSCPMPGWTRLIGAPDVQRHRRTGNARPNSANEVDIPVGKWGGGQWNRMDRIDHLLHQRLKDPQPGSDRFSTGLAPTDKSIFSKNSFLVFSKLHRGLAFWGEVRGEGEGGRRTNEGNGWMDEGDIGHSAEAVKLCKKP